MDKAKTATRPRKRLMIPPMPGRKPGKPERVLSTPFTPRAEALAMVLGRCPSRSGRSCSRPKPAQKKTQARGAVSFFFLLLHRRPRPLCPPDDGAGPSTPLTAQTGPGLISSQEPAAAICATPSVLHVSITRSTWETTRCPARQLFALPDNVRKALCEARKCVQQIKLTPLARNLFTLPIRGELCFVFCFWPLLVRTGLVLCISIGGNLYFRCIFIGQPIFVTIVY